MVEVLAPTCAAISASVGVSAEYVGRVAVADGKEIAAVTIQAAAESEAWLAKSERAKAVLPFLVGLSATAASFALLCPVLIQSLEIKSLQSVTEIYFFCPLVAVIAAAVGGLASQESRLLASNAINLGNRRFAKAGQVGKTWLSTTEQIVKGSERLNEKWKTFFLTTIPAPVLGAIVPGPLEFKAVVTAATAAALCAYYLANAEYYLSQATDAVALKSRAAAVADTYANQVRKTSLFLIRFGDCMEEGRNRAHVKY